MKLAIRSMKKRPSHPESKSPIFLLGNFYYVHPYLGKKSNLANMLQVG